MEGELCPGCESGKLVGRWDMLNFPYGSMEDPVTLSVYTVIYACRNCNSEFEGQEAEKAKEDFVKEYLKGKRHSDDIQIAYGLELLIARIQSLNYLDKSAMSKTFESMLFHRSDDKWVDLDIQTIINLSHKQPLPKETAVT